MRPWGLGWLKMESNVVTSGKLTMIDFSLLLLWMGQRNPASPIWDG